MEKTSKAAIMKKLEEAMEISIFAPSLGDFVGSLGMDGFGSGFSNISSPSGELCIDGLSLGKRS